MSRTGPVREATWPLRAGLWLAVVLAGAKAVLLGVPRSWHWPVVFVASTFPDVLFAVAVGIADEAALRAAASRPRIARTVRGLSLLLCLLCALYGVVSVGVFQYFGRPLNYDLLRLVGSARAMRSSLAARFTLPMSAALVLVPALFALIVVRDRRRVRAPVGLAAAAGVWILLGFSLHALRADEPRQVRLSASPHVELLRSAFVGMTGVRRPALPADFPPEDAVEFRSYSARGHGPAGGFAMPGGVPRPRNTIVIVLESVGTKYLSVYGSPFDTTPNLKSEADHALVFDNFYSHLGYTFCSFITVNFSTYPGLPWCYRPLGAPPLPPTLASVLSRRGWATVYLHNGDLEWEGQGSVLENRGYGEVHDYREFGCPALTSWGAEDRCLIDRLIRWIDRRPDKPFFAVCWTDQTHDPYATSPGVAAVDFFPGHWPGAHASDLSRYLNVLRETDHQLGRLFSALRERGLAEDTLVVLTGDHGEAFGQPHDQRGHGFTVYEEDVHVPLVLWNPRLFTPGRRIPGVGAHVDLNPTIADLLGVEPPPQWQGHSLFDPARPQRAFFLASVGEYLFGVRDGEWKYVFDATGGPEMLFDLASDPQEQRNEAPVQPALSRRLRQRIAGWVSFEDEYLQGRAR